MIYILSCVWLDYMVQYFQCKNCVGSSPKTKKCVASFLVPVYSRQRLHPILNGVQRYANFYIRMGAVRVEFRMRSTQSKNP